MGTTNYNHCPSSTTDSDNYFFQPVLLKILLKKNKTKLFLYTEKKCICIELSISHNSQQTSGRRKYSLKGEVALKDKF